MFGQKDDEMTVHAWDAGAYNCTGKHVRKAELETSDVQSTKARWNIAATSLSRSKRYRNVENKRAVRATCLRKKIDGTVIQRPIKKEVCRRVSCKASARGTTGGPWKADGKEIVGPAAAIRAGKGQETIRRAINC